MPNIKPRAPGVLHLLPDLSRNTKVLTGDADFIRTYI